MAWLDSIRKLIADVKAEHSTARVSLRDFTPKAEQGIALAGHESKRQGLGFTGAEHLLLGLLRLGEGQAVAALGRLNLDEATIRQAMEPLLATGLAEKPASEFDVCSPRLRRVLLRARAEAKALDHAHVGTEHLLLALLAEPDGVVAQTLAVLNTDPAKIREALQRESVGESSQPPHPNPEAPSQGR